MLANWYYQKQAAYFTLFLVLVADEVSSSMLYFEDALSNYF